jgi:hypothetical protein
VDAIDVTDNCKGCRASVKVDEEQIARMLSKIKAEDSVSDKQYALRLEVCRQCASLSYESTCMHCGCLVAFRAKFKNQSCPHPNEAVRKQWEITALEDDRSSPTKNQFYRG